MQRTTVKQFVIAILMVCTLSATAQETGLNKKMTSVKPPRQSAPNPGQMSRNQASREENVAIVPTDANLVKATADGSLAPSTVGEVTNVPVLDENGAPVSFETRIGIGMGGSTPDAKLDVAGGVKASSFLSVTSRQMNGSEIWNSTDDGNGIQSFATGNGWAWGVYSASKGANGIGTVGLSFKADQTVDDRTFGVAGINQNLQGSGVLGWSVITDGGSPDQDYPIPAMPIGILGISSSSNSVTAYFDQRGPNGGTIISGRASGSEVFNVASNGNVVALGVVSAAGYQRGASVNCSNGLFVSGLDSALNPICNSLPAASIDTSAFASKAYVDTAVATLAALPPASPVVFAQTHIQSGDTLTDVGAFQSSYNVPANSLHEGSVIEVWAAGVHTSDAQGDFPYGVFSYAVKVGSTVVVPALQEQWEDRGTINRGWNLQARIICTSVSGNSAVLESQGVVTFRQDSSSTADNATTISIDRTVDQPLRVTLASTMGNISTTMRQLIVKVY